MTLLHSIEAICTNVLQKLFPEADASVEITPATNSKFGHYQCNSAMKLAKTLKMKPRDIADKMALALEQDPMFAKVEVAGPGFINFTLANDYLDDQIQISLLDPRCGSLQTSEPRRVVIDFSSPNIAKEMHVGHLRSTIIGDCIARTLEFMGHDVLRLNHVGDWGTQFGMLITLLNKDSDNINKMELSDLVIAYKESKQHFDNNPAFKKEAQLAVVSLQSGDPKSLEIWNTICNISRIAFEEIYKILDVKINERGESFYNPMLKDIITDLDNKKLITKSDGAKCVYIDGFTNREGDPLPLIVQKSDGGFNYATTDLAALRHRVDVEKANWIIYVTDAGQAQHFSMVFAAANKAKYFDPEQVRLDHVPFGLVLRADGKKFKTREGDTEKLIDLLHGAQKCAKDKLLEREHDDLSDAELDEMANILGINAVKYADLSNNRTSDYTFSFDKMLQFEGNTAAFVCYAYVRIQSIKRKIDTDIKKLQASEKIQLVADEEIALGLQILQFPEVIESFSKDLLPNRLTEYLFTTAEKFHTFFHNCRVEGVSEQNSRLLLCEATAKVLEQGLYLLGLRPLSKM